MPGRPHNQDHGATHDGRAGSRGIGPKSPWRSIVSPPVARVHRRRRSTAIRVKTQVKEAVPKLEAVGELGLLEREYLKSVKDELVWVPVDEEE